MGFDTRRIVRKRNYRARAHVPDGFPHFYHAFPHHCICLQECCQQGDGCACKDCACKFNLPHGEDYSEYTEEAD